MKIYVGNLSFNTTDADLEAAFSAHGKLTSAQVVMDRETGRSRGFGFVEMDNQAEADNAIRALNGSDLQGRSLTVNPAKPAGERTGGGRGSYGGGGGGGGARRW
ncbi:MAG: RNA-binding protein [Chloroflexi bacterium]|nr:RNA-binding protein [Chloroflexota bacterium]